MFLAKNMDFKVEYVTNIRDWQNTMPKVATLYGAYRRRTVRDNDVVPHSFTFIRRDRISSGQIVDTLKMNSIPLPQTTSSDVESES